ncbi:MAG: histidine--tRNA ligase [Candidatus Nanopelagicales bacterium]|nr:histidine--tRNA ligase [Candidatus Nanopelagicales bacterium]
MPERIHAPKGVAEYVPPESTRFLHTRRTLIEPLVNAGYRCIELPVFEDTSLYVRGVGEGTDIVGKEMYTFEDRGGRSISLRPEGTAGVVRSMIEHGLARGGLPVKLWYAGPFFRAERPQRGRYRQFNQVGMEAIGYDDPALDAEVIALTDAGLRALGLTGFRLLVNSLGDVAERPAYRDQLTEFIKGLDLDQETLRRAELNPLRLLDDKRREVKALLADAPVLRDFISAEARAHHDQVCEYLTVLGVAFEEDPKLVRGLDYYTRTTFEFVHEGLGSQSAIGGGGRFDGLVADLGGDDMSGVGCAIGIERAMLACRAEALADPPAGRVDVFLVPVGGEAKRSLVRLLAALRRAGVRADLAYGDRSMKGGMRAADRSGAELAVIVGERELADGSAMVKHMSTGVQATAPVGDVGGFVRAVQGELARSKESVASSARTGESATADGNEMDQEAR